MRYFIILLGIVIVAVAWFQLSDNTPKTQPQEVAVQEEIAEPDVIIDIKGTNYSFSEKEVRVRKGDVVQINFSSTLGFHNWVVDEFNTSTKTVRPGTTDSVTFTADTVGTFEYYCSVGSHRERGMVGALIVEE